VTRLKKALRISGA